MSTDASKPWYREFWMWFVFTPPLISVVVGLSLVTTAVRHGDALVVDHYTQAGRSLHRDDSLTRAVGTLGLEARMVVDREDGQISVLLEGSATAPDSLSLLLAHPTHAERDVALELRPDVTGIYRGQAEAALGGGRYYLRLRPEDNTWLLTREVRLGEEITVLALTDPRDEG